MKGSFTNFKNFLALMAGIFFFTMLNSGLQAQNCTVNAGVDDAICPNSQMKLHGTSAGSLTIAPNVHWTQRSGPSVIIDNPYDPNTTVSGYTAGNTYSFYYWAKCDDGTLVRDSVNVVVWPLSTASAGGDRSSCPGTNVLTLAGSMPDAGNGETGLWQVEGTNNGVSFANATLYNTTISLDPNACGTTILRWTIYGPNSCQSYANMTVTNYGGASTVDAGPDQTLNGCYDVTTFTTLNGSGGGCGLNGQSGHWTVISGPNIPTLSNATVRNPTLSNLIQGTYRLRWDVTGSCANGTAYVKIVVPAALGGVTVASAGGGGQVFCDGRTTFTLTGNNPLLTNETGTWTVTPGSDATINSPHTPITTVNVPPNSSGTYNFTYTILNTVTGCSYSAGTSVTFNIPPTISIDGDIVLPCGDSIATVTYTASGGGGVTWTIISGPTNWYYPTIPAGPFNATTSPMQIYHLSGVGTYTIRFSINSGTGAGCATATADVNITTSQNPTSSNSGTPQLLSCNVDHTNLAGNIAFKGIGHWTAGRFPAGFPATIADPYLYNTAISNLHAGVYRFTWIIDNGEGCPPSASSTRVIMSSGTPTQATAGSNSTVCYGSPIILSGNPPAEHEWGLWTVTPSGPTFSNAAVPNPVVNGLALNTLYTFTWTISNACNSTSAQVQIQTTFDQGPKQAYAGPDQCFSNINTTQFTLHGNNALPGTGLWTEVDGNMTGVIAVPTDSITSVTVPGQGTYLFQWALSQNGCGPTLDTVAITIAPAVTNADAGPDQTICGTAATMQANYPVSGDPSEIGTWTQTAGITGTGVGPVITAVNSPTTTITFFNPGYYQFTWTITNGACSGAADNVVVAVSFPPNTANAGSDQTICAQSSYTLAANAANPGTVGSWNIVSAPNTPTFTPNMASPTATISGLITGRYKLRWTITGGQYCSDSHADVVITVAAPVSAGSDQSYCNATTVQLTGNAGSVGTWTNYSHPAGSPPTITPTSPPSNIATASGLVLGGYTFKYAVSYAGCPIDSAHVHIFISGQPTIALAGDDQTLCRSATPYTIYLHANTAVIGTGLWTIDTKPDGDAGGSAGSFSNPTNPLATYAPASPGLYIFKWTITAGTCTSADQVRVNLYEPPTIADAGSDQTICGTVATMAANTPTAGIGAWTQVSKPAGAPDASFTSLILPNTTVTGLQAGNYVFRWTISNGPACTPTTATVNITDHTAPTIPDAGSDATICQATPTTYTLQGNTITVGTGLWTENTSTVTFNDATNPHAIATFPGPGVYHLHWTATNPYAGGSCVLSDEVIISVDAHPSTANAGPPVSACLFAPVYMNATAPAVGTGLWSVFSKPGGSGVVTFISPSSPTTQVLGLSTGVYVFNWTVSNGVCTPSTAPVTVTILAIPPTAIAGANQSICNGTTVTMDGNSPGLTPNYGIWSQVFGSPPEPATVTFTNANNPLTPVTGLTALGIYHLKWTVTNGSCFTSDAITVTKYPDVVLTCPGDQTICTGGTATMTISATGGSGTYTYTWESSPTGSSPWTLIPGVTGNTYTTPVLTSDMYYRVTDDCGFQTCMMHVNVVPDPVILSVSANPTICSGATATISVNATNGVAPLLYQWYTGTTCGGTTNIIPGATSSSYTTPALSLTTYYRVKVWSAGNGCNTVYSNCISVFVPNISVQPQGTTLCTGGTHTMTVAATSQGGSETYAYQWQYSPTISPYTWGNVTSGSGGTTATYTTPVLGIATYYYRCIISITSPAGCADLVTNAATVISYNDPVVQSQTGDLEICQATSTSFSVTVTGGVGTLSYQWQIGTKLGGPLATSCAEVDTWTNVSGGSGANTTTYTTPVMNTPGLYFYRCYITQTGVGCGPISSACSKLTVDPIPNVVSTPQDQSICSGTSSATMILTSSVAGTTYAWSRTSPSGISTSQATSGTGDITGAVFTTTNYTPTTVTYTITPTGPAPTHCVGSSITATVVVDAIPDIYSASSQAQCNHLNVSYTPTSHVSGTTFAWTASLTTGIVTGFSATGTGTINDVLSNNGTADGSVTYVITPTGPAPTFCTGTSFHFVVTVHPTPDVIATPAAQTFCSGGTTSIVLSTNVPGTTFYYALPTISGSSGNITGGTSRNSPGNTSGITDVLTNTTAAIQTATYTVYPIINGCVGTAITVVITVNPVPFITSGQTVNICADVAGNASVNYTIVTNPSMTGVLFTWPVPTEPGLTGGTARVTPSNANLTDTYNNGLANSIKTATYTVHPAAPAILGSCNGVDQNVLVNVIPFPIVTATPNDQTICSGTATSITLSSSLANPLIAQYSWTVSTILGTVTGASGRGFATGTSISQTLVNTTNTIGIVRYVVTSRVQGYNTCTGNSINIDITVNPTPQVTTPGSQVICHNTNTTAITFTTTNIVGITTYTWTNNQPGIGLAASGSGDIASFTGLNTTTAPIVATIGVTPTLTNAGITCPGSAVNFTITVNPLGQVNAVANQVVCDNTSTGAVNFSTVNTVGTTTYTWVNSTPSIGLAASGSGNIAAFTAHNSGTAPVTATITVTPTFTNGGVGCTGSSISYTYTVNPAGQVIQPGSQTNCNGTATIQVDFSTNNTGGVTTYTWMNDQSGIGLASSGTGNSILSFTATNTGTATVVANIVVTPHFANGGTSCTGSSKTYTYTVYPTPKVSSVSSKAICNNTAIGYTINSLTAGTTYTWTASILTPPTGGTITGFSDCSVSCTVINHTLVNTGSSAGVVRYVIIPTANGCIGTSFNFDVTVQPVAVVIPTPTVQTICDNTATSIALSTTTTGTVTYSWTATQTTGVASGFGSGSGSNIAQTITNTTTSPATVTYHIIPSIGGCAGTPIDVVITINPAGQVIQPSSQIICNGTTTGTVVFSTNNTVGTTTYTWTNSNTTIGCAASGSGDVPSFTGLNSGTAPNTGNFVVIPTFTNAGVSCTGTSKSFTITVNPTPVVTQSANQVVCNGTSTGLVTFTTVNTGGTSTYTWTNDTPSIGLAASGSGNIAAFTAINSGSAPVTATIVTTPHFVNASGGPTCDGTTETFTITVNPTGQVVQPSSQVVCRNTSTGAITFSTVNTVGITTYAWTNSNTNIGLAASGSGDIAPFTATNTGNTQISATITVIPTFAYDGRSCAGPSKTCTIKVNPAGQVTQVANQVICAGGMTSAVTFTTTNTDGVTTYAWTNNAPSIGLSASGSGNIASFTALNSTNVPVVATITVTPTYTNGGTNCVGADMIYTITVNPTANVIATPSTSSFCSGLAANIVLTSSVAGTTFTYPVPTVTGTSGAASVTGGTARLSPGNTNPITDVLTNITAALATVTYHITPRANNCDGTPFDVVITVYPKPVLKVGLTQNLCQGESASLALKTIPSMGSNVTYSWPAPTLTGGMTYTDNGIGNTILDDYVNPTSSPQTATYHVTPTATAPLGGCVGDAGIVVITVNPVPVMTVGLVQTICSGTHANIVLTTTPFTPGTLYTYPAPDVTGGMTGGVSRVIKSSANITDLLVNPTLVAQTATYHVTPWINNCAGAIVDVVITVDASPTTSSAGPNQTVCGTPTTKTITMAANTPLSGTGAWSVVTVPSGALTPHITTPASPTTTITGLGMGSATGSVVYKFRWTITNGTCNTPATLSASDMTAELDYCCPVTYSEYNNYLCKNSTNFAVDVLANGDYSPSGLTLQVNSTPVLAPVHGTLTYSGGSTFLYTPTAGYSGTDKAVIAVCDNAPTPCCTNDTIYYTVVQAVTANAGSDQSLCNQYTTFLTGNYPPTGSTGNWTYVSGPSVVTPSPSNSPVATVSGLTGSSVPYVFKYTVSTTTGGVTCTDFATVSVTNYHLPTFPFAGNDQKICQTATTVSTTLTGNTPVYGTGMWEQVSKPVGASDAVIATPGNPTTTVTNLVAGTYTFSWGITNGVCDVLKDMVDVTVYPPCHVEAGSDQTICEGSTATLSQATAVNCGTMSWGTLGTGYFNDPTMLHPTYTPGALDITNGHVTLYIQCASCCGNPCPGDISYMNLTITKAPVAHAGTDATICSGSTFPLSAATANNYASLLWTSTGTGAFTPSATVLNPVYTPSPADISSGSVSLTLKALATAPCSDATSTLVLTIKPQATAATLSNTTICSGSNYPLTSNAQNYASLVWTTSGTGTFSSTTVPNPTYTPSAADITNGSVTLTLNVTAFAPCSNLTRSMVLTIQAGPTANAGADGAVCRNTAYTVSGAGTTHSSSVLWTHNGLGNLTNASTLTPTYTPNPSETGPVVLTLHASAISPCATAATDDMTLTIIPAATAFAGPDETICSGNTFLLSGATATNYASLTWSGGTGTFDNIHALNPLYTPSAGEISAGTATLTLTATGLGICTNAVSSMVLSIKAHPVVGAGPDVTICSSAGSATLAGIASNYASVAWTTSGTGTFGNAALPATTYIPSAADIATGQVQLTLTANGNGNCPGVSDFMVLTIWPSATAYAGPDATICQGSNFELTAATATHYTTVTWSGGTGSFDNTHAINPTYTPGPADITAGTVTLTLTAAGLGNCANAISTMVLAITKAPTVGAGPDITICTSSPSATLAGIATNYASVAWTTSGTGTFGNAALPATTYTPSAADIATGQVQLTLTANGNGNCPGVSDFMVLTIWPSATAYAGPDATICQGSNFELTAATATHYTTVTWSGGTGSFDNTHAINPTYTPGPADITAGTVTLTLTAAGLGNCANAISTMVLAITKAPTVGAGPDITICTSSPSATLAGIATNYASVAWTTSGTGTFGNAALPATTYTPSAADIATGQVQLTLTANGNGNCPGVSDFMVLTIWPSATAYAGPAATICSGSKFTINASSATNFATLDWSTTGNGLFDDSHTLHPTYSPSLSDITAGTVTLTLTAHGLGNCANAISSMVLTILPRPVVEAGPDGTMCEGHPFTVAAGTASVTNAVSFVWTAPGPGLLTNALNNLTPTYTPAPGQIGFVTLTLTATGNDPCGTVSDQATVEFKASAIITSQPVGAIVCSGSNHLMTVVATAGVNGLTYQWQSASSCSLNPTDWNNIPGANSSSYNALAINTTTSFRVIITQALYNCDVLTSSCATVSVIPPVVSNAGSDATICEGSTYLMTATATAGTYSSLLWTTSGDGYFNNAATLDPIYTPGTADKALGHVHLTLTAGGNAPCANLSDEMILTIQPAPTANAGQDAIICESSTSYICNATATNYASFYWTTSGTGTFSDIHILNPVYIPSAADIAAGCVYLTLHVTGYPPCGDVTDVMKLCIVRVPVANAGPDDMICQGFSYHITGSSASYYGDLTWTTSGTGTFDNNKILHPVYTPSQADILAGSVILTMSLTANSPCPNTSDAMVLTIHLNPVPTASVVTNVSCRGFSNGSVTVTVTSGTPPYHYRWNDAMSQTTATATGLTAGTYAVTVTDSYGCQGTASTTITEPAEYLTAAVIAQTNILCHGGNNGSMTVSASGGTKEYTYLWNNNQTTTTATSLTVGTYTVTVTDAHFCTATAMATLTEPAAPLSATIIAHTNVLCHGGNNGDATVSAAGGTSGYYYLWSTAPAQTSTVASGLTAGTYAVTVTDMHSCQATASVTITEPAPIVVTVVGHTDVLCHGGNNATITVSVTGGATAYSYLWNNTQTAPTATSLTVGTYTVTVTDANSCVATTSYMITEPEVLTIAATLTHVSCYTYSNGSIDLSAGGGTPPYYYAWNTGATTQDVSGLSAGTYSVSVTDSHSCFASGSYVITQPPAWSIGITGVGAVCCTLAPPYPTQVYTATVGGSYTGPVTYQWVVEGGTILSGQNQIAITVAWSCCGSGKVWLTVTDSKPCVLTTFIPIVTTQAPVPVITGPAQAFTGPPSSQYCTPDIPGHLYSWAIQGGSITSGQGTSCIMVTWGPYPVCGCGSVTVYETNGCTGSATYPVTLLPGTNITVSGYVSYDNSYATRMNGVTVQLRNSANVIMGTTVTINNPQNSEPGYYAFSDVPDGTNYKITGSYNGTWGGNNATDALIVQLTTIGAFTPPLTGLRLIVADVNASNTISGLDALYIKLRTVGSIASYPAGDWAISEKTFDISGAPVTKDLTILCFGDVNGSYLPEGFKDAKSLSTVEDGLMTVPVGEPFVYNIRSSKDADLGAMTLFLGYDREKYEVIDVDSKLEGMKYALADGKISVAWADTKPLKVASGDLILGLNMRVRNKITEPSQVFAIKPGSEFADILATPYDDFNLKMADVMTPGGPGDISLYNYPNPFAGTTTIVYNLPETGHARLVLTNLYGKVISTLVDQQEKAGSHTIVINPADLNMAPGVYLYKIIFDGSTDTHEKVNKMVFTK